MEKVVLRASVLLNWRGHGPLGLLHNLFSYSTKLNEK